MAFIEFEPPSDKPDPNLNRAEVECLESWDGMRRFKVDGVESAITATSGDYDVKSREFTVFLEREGNRLAEADIYFTGRGAGIDRVISGEVSDEAGFFVRFIAATVRYDFPNIQFVEYDEENLL
jgi:hypothetical protein